MVTITRTFNTQFDKNYVVVAPATTVPIREVVHFRNEVFDADERVSCYLDTANAVIDIGSFNIGKIPNLDEADSAIEEALLLGKAESESQKIGIRVLTRKNNTGTWLEIAEFILLNYGRKDYLDMRTKTGYPTRIMETNDAIAIQLIDYGDGLLWDIDLITISFAASIEIEKKNNLDALTARLAALELALEGRLINLPANSLLGRNTDTGAVERIDRSVFKAADSELLDGINSDRFVTGDDWSRTLGGSTNDLNALFQENSGFIDAWSGGNLPPSTSHINGFQVRHRNPSASWGMQAGCQHNLANEFYFRTITTPVANQPSLFNPWRRIWNDGNYNPNSQSQVFTPTVKGFADSNLGTGLTNTPAGNVGFEVRSVSDGGAIIALHRPGRYAIHFGLDTDNALAIGGWSLGATRFRIWHEAYGIPVWQAPSDARLKKQISPIKSALELINECNPVRFQYNSEIKKSELYGSKAERKKFHYGFVAQDFPIGDLVYEKENGFLGIDYIEIIPFLVKAIQELTEQIEDINLFIPINIPINKQLCPEATGKVVVGESI
jgi:hypothetical protein